MRTAGLAVFVVACLAACGLSISGSAPGDGSVGPDDGGVPDGASGDGRPPGDASGDIAADVALDATRDASGEAAPPADGGVDVATDACASTCGLAPPQGWTLVAYAQDQATSCPSGFTTADGLEAPTAGWGACTCGSCTQQGTPTCDQGSMPSTYDTGSGGCGTAGITLAANGGTCSRQSGTAGAHVQAFGPPGSGGTCTAPSVSHPNAVSSTSVRACIPSDACASVCAPSVVGAFAACMQSAGDVNCPPGVPNKHTVGTSVSLSCPGCSCSVVTVCSGTIDFYTDQNCNNQSGSIATGACVATTQFTFGSYKWNAGTPTSTCAITPPAGTASLTGVSTICCP